MDRWQRDRFKFGICDVESNYEFYFKWLLSKVKQVFIVEGIPDTVDIDFMKEHLLLDGEVCFTEFNDQLYALNGNRGGEPDEYYRPTHFIIANPRLGSKDVKIGEDGVVVFNTGIDKSLYWGGGLFQLIKQTATLLADNVVSINCAQINGRVTALFTADTPAQAESAKAVLKRIYAGEPYNVVIQDMVNKIGINPMSQSGTNGTITELVELQNFIVANFFQSIGIKSNEVMKKERLITDEINSQNDYLAVSVLDILTSWQEGFDKVNEMFGTQIKVKLNPVVQHVITDPIGQSSISQDSVEESTEEPIEEPKETEDLAEEPKEEVPTEEPTEEPKESEEPTEEIKETLIEAESAAAQIIEESMDKTEDEVAELDGDGGESNETDDNN